MIPRTSAVGEPAEMLIEIVADIGRKPAVKVIGQKRDDARALGGHGQVRSMK